MGHEKWARNNIVKIADATGKDPLELKVTFIGGSTEYVDVRAGVSAEEGIDDFMFRVIIGSLQGPGGNIICLSGELSPERLIGQSGQRYHVKRRRLEWDGLWHKIAYHVEGQIFTKEVWGGGCRIVSAGQCIKVNVPGGDPVWLEISEIEGYFDWDDVAQRFDKDGSTVDPSEVYKTSVPGFSGEFILMDPQGRECSEALFTEIRTGQQNLLQENWSLMRI